MANWLIEFRFPEGICYAGEYKDGKLIGLGIAATKKTAKRFESADIAGRMAANHYGSKMAEFAFIVQDEEEDGS